MRYAAVFAGTPKHGFESRWGYFKTTDAIRIPSSSGAACIKKCTSRRSPHGDTVRATSNAVPTVCTEANVGIHRPCNVCVTARRLIHSRTACPKYQAESKASSPIESSAIPWLVVQVVLVEPLAATNFVAFVVISVILVIVGHDFMLRGVRARQILIRKARCHSVLTFA